MHLKFLENYCYLSVVATIAYMTHVVGELLGLSCSKYFFTDSGPAICLVLSPSSCKIKALRSAVHQSKMAKRRIQSQQSKKAAMWPENVLTVLCYFLAAIP